MNAMAQLRKNAARLGCEVEDASGEYPGLEVLAPPNRVFVAQPGCHALVQTAWDRQTTKDELAASLIESLNYGLAPCDCGECDP